jgi:hypothetical protein
MFTPLIERDRVPQALLLVGQNKTALVKEARTFAETLAAPADRFEYFPEGKAALHPVERIREFKEEVFLPPYQGNKKVFLLFEAERMWPQSSNALLKTFEEPLPSSYLVLTTSRREKILPTILSRCQTFFVPGPKEPLPLPPGIEELCAHGKYSDSRLFFKEIKTIAAHFDEIEDPLALQQAFFDFLERLEERYPTSPHLFEEARLKFERSTSLSALLESLFIKLGFL